ncbi:MAG: tRNA uridine-5-carboxymethylaminomethyl(34) synthesis enzyme MnmG [Sphingomonas fennica]
MNDHYDVIVVGGGHAGTEAAAVVARSGRSVALVTTDLSAIGAMSCNPSIGGVGKGHLVREIDVFDGVMPAAADEAAIHYRLLNRSRGPAVHGPRVQADRRLYREAVQRELAKHDCLSLIEAHVECLWIDEGVARGVDLADGRRLTARAIVLTTGTFLGGRLFEGEHRAEGGRRDARAATTLAGQLRTLGLPMFRLKTGTPPRLDGRTIDWARLDRQDSDDEQWSLSALAETLRPPPTFCAVTRTNHETHRVIRDGLARSPLADGAIVGRGPRYCPSIEDKVARFGDRDGHQIFLEPEGLDDALVYPNGFSTSLPIDIQASAIRTIAGLEQADIVLPGYAVEYDAIDPRSLNRDLSVRAFRGLFFAGQINGTTGYEEAAAQGLAAGLGAIGQLGGAATTFDRQTSYIGVMIDDLVLQGVTEPYRMLTSRAEHRLYLRADNAVARLGSDASAANVIGVARRADIERRSQARERIDAVFNRRWSGAALAAQAWPVAVSSENKALREWVRNPQVTAAHVISIANELRDDEGTLEEAIIDVRYESYVLRERRLAEGIDDRRALDSVDYASMAGLSTEMTEKLVAAAPRTLGEARRIRGITPTALALIAARAAA